MITIVDYGLGNIRAFANVYKRLNISNKVARTPDDLKDASKIILPGVGAFDYAMQLLNDSGLREELEIQVVENKKPVLGICVGMQMLAHSSEEGKLPGLGWIEGVVKKFDPQKIPYKTRLPHMGWNDVTPRMELKLFDGITQNPLFYFLHSYYFECYLPEDSIAVADYGGEFVCAVNHDNIYGVQFHPEKSHQNGIQLLKNFAVL